MTRSRLSDLQRLHVVDEDGARVGRVFDAAAHLEHPGRAPRIDRLLVGRGGLFRRLGIGRARAIEVPLSEIVRIEGRTVVVARRPGRSS